MRFADRPLFPHDGGVAAVGGPDVVTPALVERVYGMRATVATVDGHRVVVPE